MNEVKNELNYAGFWIRAIASLIDSILVLMVIVPLVYLLADFRDVAVIGAVLWLLFIIIVSLLPIVPVFVFWIFKSATPGKIILNLVIVDANTGDTPDISQWVVRFVAYAISVLTFFIGFFWIAIDARKQGLHDKLARTVVVKKVSS